MNMVAVHNVHKSYNGKPAVKDLSFAVEPGEILGLIGPNGAGKSTTVKMILNFMKPDSGKIEIFGHKMKEADKNRIGYLPEEKGLYKNLSAMEAILYLASLKGMKRGQAEKRAVDLLDQTGLFENKKMKIKHMSKGMGQMIQFIVTIIHDPDLLIIDEPFSGLDPVNTELMKNRIAQLRDEGKAVILSTHQMNQVEVLCDRVLMIDKGSEVLYGRLEDIKAGYREHSVHVKVDGEIGELTGVIEKRRINNRFELVLAPEVTPQDILDSLRQKGYTVSHFSISTPSLHDIFLNIAGGKHE